MTKKSNNCIHFENKASTKHFSLHHFVHGYFPCFKYSRKSTAVDKKMNIAHKNKPQKLHKINFRRVFILPESILHLEEGVNIER